MKKPLLIVFSILLVLALAVGAFFYFKPFTQSTLERDQRTTFSGEETAGINASVTENEALREDNTVKKENAFFSFMGGATTEIVGPQEVRV
jgi:membrane protein implicated in regulation of membrane protease activity